jgi:hypothetical protein
MANPSEMPGATAVAPLTLAAYQWIRWPSSGDRLAASERAWRSDAVAGLGANAGFGQARECERRNRHHHVAHSDVEIVAGRHQIDRDAAEADGGHIAGQPGVA